MERTFDHPNLLDGKWRCPICGTAADRPVVLVPIRHVDEWNAEAEQVHWQCASLVNEMAEVENKGNQE